MATIFLRSCFFDSGGELPYCKRRARKNCVRAVSSKCATNHLPDISCFFSANCCCPSDNAVQLYMMLDTPRPMCWADAVECVGDEALRARAVSFHPHERGKGMHVYFSGKDVAISAMLRSECVVYLEYHQHHLEDDLFIFRYMALHRSAGFHYGVRGSLVSALHFFTDLTSLQLDDKMALLCLSRISTVSAIEQCCIAAVTLHQHLPRGIQLYEFLEPRARSWYISVTGRFKEEHLEPAIAFSRMRHGLASICYTARLGEVVFFAVDFTTAEPLPPSLHMTDHT